MILLRISAILSALSALHAQQNVRKTRRIHFFGGGDVQHPPTAAPASGSSVTCTMMELVYEMNAGPTGHQTVNQDICMTDTENGGMAHTINLPPAMAASLDVAHHSGRITLNIENANVTQNEITLTPNSTVMVDPTASDEESTDEGESTDGEESTNDQEDRSRHRSLIRTSGTSTLVVLRVVATNGAPTPSISDISNAVFGTNGGNLNLRSIYSSCSFGQLTFEPGTGNGFVGGVQDISVDFSVQDMRAIDVQNRVTDVVNAQLGNLRNMYTHVAYVLPSGAYANTVGDRWFAYAFFNFYLSVFNNQEIMFPSTQVHEIGHNLNLGHSSHAGQEYGDQSGLMGFSYSRTDFPQMCFNAAKSWHLGWYSSKQLEVNPSTSGTWTGSLAAFADFQTASNIEYVLIRVGNNYIEYNRAKGINAQTQEFANQVTITESASLTQTDSSAVGQLASAGQTFNIANPAVTVEVCELTTSSSGADIARLSIFVTGTTSGCNSGPTPVQTPAPVSTPAPALVSTPSPVVARTPRPTRNRMATPRPTGNRRQMRSNQPVFSPVSFPPVSYPSESFPPAESLAPPVNELLFSSNTQNVECTMYEVAIETNGGPTGHQTINKDVCITTSDGGMAHSINLPPAMAASLDVMHHSGEITLNISNANVTQNDVILSADSSVTVEPTTNAGRRLVQTSGTSTLVVLRVVANDGSPSLTASQISDAVFGTNGDSLNLRSIYSSCSFGQLTFEAGTGNGFVGGVQDITVNVNARDMRVNDFENEVTDVVNAQLGNLRSMYTHVAYVMPSGTYANTVGDTWFAYAYFNYYLSVFNNQEIMYASTQVHEIGHNLNLGHSGHAGEEYGDQSGLMGFSYSQSDFPQMCFNAAKSWHLGWYSSKQLEVNPSTSGTWTGSLAAFADFQTASNTEYVLIRVGNNYIEYNRAKGINAQTQEFANQVTITESTSLTQTNSNSVGQLASAGQTFNMANPAVTVEVCELTTSSSGADIARLSIFVTGTSSGCNSGPTPVQTPAPVSTPAPALVSTPSPVVARTPRPTGNRMPMRSNQPVLSPIPTVARPAPVGSPVSFPPVSFPPFGDLDESFAPFDDFHPFDDDFHVPFPPVSSPHGNNGAPNSPIGFGNPTSLFGFSKKKCAKNEFHFELELQTDNKPEETSWQLYNFAGTFSENSPAYNVTFKKHRITRCLNKSDNYGWRIFDSGNNGIDNSLDGQGYFSVHVNGMELATGGNFNNYVDVYVIAPCAKSTKLFKAVIQTDSAGSETTWNLNSREGSLTAVNWAGGPYPNKITQIINSCLPVKGCYDFTINDAGGNGFARGEGLYQISFKGATQRFSTFEGGSSETTTFGGACETVSV